MIYLHYKGGLYRVIAEGVHTETQEKLTTYVSLETGKVWVRPSSMFHELVEVDVTETGSQWIPRFHKLSN